MTKVLLSTASFLLFAFTINAQAPNWAWAKRGSGVNTENGNAIASDKNGNIYVAGNFMSPSVTFGTNTLNNTTTIGTNDYFLVKYDVSGSVLWATSDGGIDNEGVYSITTDTSGNIYVAGMFYSATMTIGTFTLTNTGSLSNDIFIIKYDASGNIIWATSAGGTDYDNCNGIGVDDNQNVYIGGSFQGTSSAFGTITLTNSNINTSDIYVAKLSPAGNFIWAKSAGASDYDAAFALSADAGGNVYATGYFQSASVTFGTFTINNANTGNGDVFTVKYDSAGTALWAAATGNLSSETGYGIRSDLSGNVYVTGSFQSTTISFGTSTLTNSNPSSSDVFVIKFDASGNPVWGRNFGGYDSENAETVAIDLSGNIYVTGSFGSTTLYFGTDSLVNANINGTTDVFVGKYDASGNPLWIKKAGGTDYDTGMDLTVDLNGIVSITGSFQSPTIGFGSTTLTITSSGSGDVFVASLAACSSVPPDICMVTADSMSKFNIIIWDKTSYTNVDSFIVYREITTNNYQRIASIPYDSLSQFVDTVAALYFPNTGNPNAGTYRYKLQTHDTCGNYSALGPYHNTIYMTNVNGTFSWPQLYTIENGPNPVNAYVLMRDDNSTGNWQAVNSVAGTQQSVTDPAYNVWVATANWRVQTLWSISCTPTLRTTNNFMTTYSVSKSNTKNPLTSVNEISLNDLISVYPNPSSGVFAVTLPANTTLITVTDVLGNVIYSTAESVKQIDISSFADGIYFLNVKTAEGFGVKKIVKN